MKNNNFDNCLFLEGKNNIINFFKDKKNCLLLVGKGFDPRTASFLNSLKQEKKDFTVWIIDYNEQSNKVRNGKTSSRSNDNLNSLKQLCNDLTYDVLEVPSYKIGSDGKRTLIISESIKKEITKQKLENYDYIIVDISAMTKAASFSLINLIYKRKKPEQKLYVIVTENSDCDDKISPSIVEDSAELLQGFRTFSFSLASDDDYTIWFPAMGGYSKEAFETIYKFLRPIEICPVLPFPSVKINRSEYILRNLGELIFREYQVNKRNIIFVPEESPILVSKKLYNTVKYYESALNIDNQKSIKFVFSSQSSKLIDLGILLTILLFNKSNNIRVSFALVETAEYSLNEEYDVRYEKTYCFGFDDDELNW